MDGSVMGLREVIASHPFFTCSSLAFSRALWMGMEGVWWNLMCEPAGLLFSVPLRCFTWERNFKMGLDKASFRIWAPANRAASGWMVKGLPHGKGRWRGEKRLRVLREDYPVLDMVVAWWPTLSSCSPWPKNTENEWWNLDLWKQHPVTTTLESRSNRAIQEVDRSVLSLDNKELIGDDHVEAKRRKNCCPWYFSCKIALGFWATLLEARPILILLAPRTLHSRLCKKKLVMLMDLFSRKTFFFSLLLRFSKFSSHSSALL